MSKLTDEQLRKMLADQDKRSYGDEGRLDPYVASDILTEFLTLRAERAKPTQSDAERAQEIAADVSCGGCPGETQPELLLYNPAELVSEIVSFAASIRAEGSAERAKLEAALDAYREAVRVDAVMEGPRFGGCNASALKRAWEADLAALAQPAESGATLDVREYESLHNDPHKLWVWFLMDGDKLIDTQDGFASEYEAISHGRCVQRNYARAKP